MIAAGVNEWFRCGNFPYTIGAMTRPFSAVYLWCGRRFQWTVAWQAESFVRKEFSENGIPMNSGEKDRSRKMNRGGSSGTTCEGDRGISRAVSQRKKKKKEVESDGSNQHH
jgi:hypothetical protein